MTTIILSSCNRPNNSANIPLDINPVKDPSEQIVKTWVYVCDNLFVSCFIQIKADSTFNYESGGCMGTCYTSGKWTLKGNQLVLNSFDEYAPKTMTVVPEPDEQPEKTTKINKSTDTSTPGTFTISLDPSIVSASFSPHINLDSTTTFFKDRLFVLDKDTLYELTENMGTRSGSKFCASKSSH